MMRYISDFSLPYVGAWLLTFSVASAFQSHFALNDLIAAGINISLDDRLSLTLQDWLGLLPTYGVSIALGFLVVFPLISFCRNKFKLEHTLANACLFGSSALVVVAIILYVLQPVFDASLIADLQSTGFYAQLVAALLGGMLFGVLYRRPSV